MTDQAFRSLALHYVEEEMSAVRLSERTKMMNRNAHAVFLRWLSKRSLSDLRTVSKKDLVSFHGYLAKVKSKRTGENLAAATINGRFHSVCMLFSVLYRSGAIAENPAHGLNLDLPLPSGWRRRPLSRDEINRFLESIEPANVQGLKDRTLFELIYSSGLRVSEAAALKVGDIDFERRVMVVRGKFDRDRVVPFSEVAQAFLQYYLGDKLSQAEAWVFVGYGGATKGRHIAGASISERFRTLLRRFDMDKKEISTHSIRHSTATHLLENGASVRHVQELLGHRNIESTVRYTHVMTDSLAKIYRRHHPREHELFEVVDEAYEKRLENLLVGRKKA